MKVSVREISRVNVFHSLDMVCKILVQLNIPYILVQNMKHLYQMRFSLLDVTYIESY